MALAGTAFSFDIVVIAVVVIVIMAAIHDTNFYKNVVGVFVVLVVQYVLPYYPYVLSGYGSQKSDHRLFSLSVQSSANQSALGSENCSTYLNFLKLSSWGSRYGII